jgi:hypothetical protein
MTCTTCDINGNVAFSGSLSGNAPDASLKALHPDFDFSGVWFAISFDSFNAGLDLLLNLKATSDGVQKGDVMDLVSFPIADLFVSFSIY